jgi:hypothetical protein
MDKGRTNEIQKFNQLHINHSLYEKNKSSNVSNFITVMEENYATGQVIRLSFSLKKTGELHVLYLLCDLVTRMQVKIET